MDEDKEEISENSFVNWEKSISELEKIVKEFEGRAISLSDGIAKFEKGVKLYKECKADLLKAERRIRVLTESLKEESFKDEF